jgi:hypothetical protein
MTIELSKETKLVREECCGQMLTMLAIKNHPIVRRGNICPICKKWVVREFRENVSK